MTFINSLLSCFRDAANYFHDAVKRRDNYRALQNIDQRQKWAQKGYILIQTSNYSGLYRGNDLEISSALKNCARDRAMVLKVPYDEETTDVAVPSASPSPRPDNC